MRLRSSEPVALLVDGLLAHRADDGETLGWLGRLADALSTHARNTIVNLGIAQSLAVRSLQHSPLVFDDPARFRREGSDEEKRALADLSRMRQTTNPTLGFCRRRRRMPRAPRSCGAPHPRIARDRLWAGRWPRRQPAARCRADRGGDADARVYVTYAGNSFDTHVQQADLHTRLLMLTADAVRGFMDDMNRLGRGDEVAMMIFTEFGRRVEERQPRHRPRHGHADVRRRAWRQGRILRPSPSLTDLDDGNMKMTTDFRRVYADDPRVARIRSGGRGVERQVRSARRVCLRSG